MLQILINTSLIWLCSLLVYELLLKRETFHRLNRIYLILTFVAGITLPLLPWSPDVHITETKTTMTGVPLVTPNPVPKTIETVAEQPVLQMQLPAWWQRLYLAGVAISILYLLRELWRLTSLYRRATITRSGKWRIAETGVSHSPFSFLHIIFVCSRDQYTNQQWAMLLQHEQQHYRHRHILDLVLMQAAQILLWFHPLVYIYRQKLRLLHEYEVDSTQPEDLQIYGRFLLEQAALSAAPAMTHSFNFSPLKNRIQMMTRNTSARKVKYRLLLLLPMLAGFMYCCAKNKEQIQVTIKGQVVTRQGIDLGYSNGGAPDTMFVQAKDGSGSRNMMVVRKDPAPEKLDGRDIFQPEQLATAPQCLKPGPQLGMNYLIVHSGLESILQKMEDGEYVLNVSNIIVDQEGHIVYYHILFPYNTKETIKGPGGFNSTKPSGLTDADKEAIHKKLSAALIGGDIAFAPAKDKNGNTVPFFLESDNLPRSFDLHTILRVKDHAISYIK